MRQGRRGGGHVGRSCLLRAVGRGRRKKGAKPMRPRPLCPPHAKLFFCEVLRLRAGGDLRKKRSFAKFALCGRHSRRPCRTTLLYLVGQISERRQLYRATWGYRWSARYQSGGSFIVLHGAIFGRSDIRAAAALSSTAPHTPQKMLQHICRAVSRVRAQSAPPQAAPLTQPRRCALPCLCGVWEGHV